MNKIKKVLSKIIEKDLFNLKINISKNEYFLPLNVEEKATEKDYNNYDIINALLEKTTEKIYILLAENNIDNKIGYYLYNNNDIEIIVKTDNFKINYYFKNTYNQ